MIAYIEESVITKTKKFLGTNEEYSAIELHDKLREYRNNIHPDRFTQFEKKLEAEDKFKTASTLLSDLAKVIENEKSSKTPSELIQQRGQYESFYLKQALDDAQESVMFYNSRIEHLVAENSRLKKMLEDKHDSVVNEKLEIIESMYKPSKHKVVSFSLLFLLTAALAIFSKIEEFSGGIRKYSSLNEDTINTLLLFSLILLIASALKQFVENRLIMRKVAEAQTPKFSNCFLNYLDRNNTDNKTTQRYFLESQVYSFIEGTKCWWKQLLANLGVKFFQHETINRLKDYFISTLLNKQLIKVSDADNLDRRFIIENKDSRDDDYEKYRLRDMVEQLQKMRQMDRPY